LWDCTQPNFPKRQKLRDQNETNIDEFYVGKFTPDGRHLVTGGKLKDRNRWSDQDNDNHILPCPLKMFDVIEGTVVYTFPYGHEEEILCLKMVNYKNGNYYITTSQDGFILRWEMTHDWMFSLFNCRECVGNKKLVDGESCMAFTVSFVPHSQNQFFMAACDEHLKLCDFEDLKVLLVS
jgi:hypothetical protein